MGLPVIKYTPPSGIEQVITFPSELSTFDPDFTNRSSHVATEGNIVAKGLLSEHALVHIGINQFPDDLVFFDAMTAFWSWVARGGEFEFYHDGDLDVLGLFSGDNPPDIFIRVQVGGPGSGLFVDPNRFLWAYCLHNRNRHRFAVIGGTGDPEVVRIKPGTAVTFHDGDPVVDEFTYIQATAISEIFPIRRRPGGFMSFDLVFRDFVEIVVP